MALRRSRLDPRFHFCVFAMIKFVSTLVFFLMLNFNLWACPSCAGSMQNESDKWIVVALGVFVLLTYIPFYILYSTIIKNRNVNNEQQESR